MSKAKRKDTSKEPYAIDVENFKRLYPEGGSSFTVSTSAPRNRMEDLISFKDYLENNYEPPAVFRINYVIENSFINFDYNKTDTQRCWDEFLKSPCFADILPIRREEELLQSYWYPKPTISQTLTPTKSPTPRSLSGYEQTDWGITIKPPAPVFTIGSYGPTGYEGTIAKEQNIPYTGQSVLSFLLLLPMDLLVDLIENVRIMGRGIYLFMSANDFSDALNQIMPKLESFNVTNRILALIREPANSVSEEDFVKPINV